MSTRLRLILAGVAVLVALAVVGPYAFIHFIEGDPPQKLTVSDAVSSGAGPTTTVAVPDSFDGTWTAAVGSQAGYRVKETSARARRLPGGPPR